MPTGATTIWQTTPDLMSLDQGAEMLRISRLSPRGGYRWYAGCCGALMFSTAKNLSIPFVSIPLRQVEHEAHADLLGPVRCHAFTESARPHADSPRATSGMYAAGTRIFLRALLAWTSGRGRRSPLRNSDGAPIAPVEVIALETRKAARPDHLK